ncbi:MAG: Asp23/Gls24 family envelope stress response protein [Peptococcaceae bacterium]|nr:Asp23/Gls24 family envelope stress response protein [Peptococcaceae bacterium]
MVVGITNIHDDVFREIIRLLLEEFDEIYTYEPKNPLAPLLGEKSVRPVITVRRPEPGEENQEQLAYEIRIALLYGANIPQVVAKIRREAAERTKLYTGYDVSAVDVYVTRLIRFEKERSAENESETPGDHQNDERPESAAGGDC